MISNPNVEEDKMHQNTVLINGTILTRGSFTLDICQDLKETSIGTVKGTIYINGCFTSKYYIKELNELESIRYYVNDIFVTKESYNSADDTIRYEFKATYFKPKFQDTDYEQIERK